MIFTKLSLLSGDHDCVQNNSLSIVELKLFVNYCQLYQTHTSQSFTINWLVFVAIWLENYGCEHSSY